MLKLRSLVTLTTAVIVAAAATPVTAQDSIVVPQITSDETHCNVIPFGSFQRYAFPQNQKYQMLVPWSALAKLPRPMIETIGFKACDDGVQKFSTIKVRIGQTSAVELGKVFAHNLGPAAQTVLDTRDYYWHRKKGRWARIGLHRPFALRNGLSLVIDIEVTGAMFLNSEFERSNAIGGFETSMPFGRLYALDWKHTPPPSGRLGTAGLRVELASRTSDLGTFGIGCKGGRKTRPTLGLAGNAIPNGTVNVSLSNGLPTSPTLLIVGFNNGAPFPIGLGSPDCSIYHSIDIAIPAATNASGRVNLPIALPAAIRNTRFYCQFFQAELRTTGLAMRGSNYGRVLVR